MQTLDLSLALIIKKQCCLIFWTLVFNTAIQQMDGSYTPISNARYAKADSQKVFILTSIGDYNALLSIKTIPRNSKKLKFT